MSGTFRESSAQAALARSPATKYVAGWNFLEFNITRKRKLASMTPVVGVLNFIYKVDYFHYSGSLFLRCTMHDTAVRSRVRARFFFRKSLPSRESFEQGFMNVNETRWFCIASWVQYFLPTRLPNGRGIWIDMHWS